MPSDSAAPSVKARYDSALKRLSSYMETIGRKRAPEDATYTEVNAEFDSQRLETLLESTTTALCNLMDASPSTGEAVGRLQTVQDECNNVLSQADCLIAELHSLAYTKVPPSKEKSDEGSNKKTPKIELSTFDEENPDIWFSQLEIQFLAAKVVDQHHRFAHLIRFLEKRHSVRINPILQEPSDKPYDKAKALLLDQYALSREQRIHRVFYQESLGADENAADILARVRPLLKDISTADLEKFIMYKNMPQSIKAHLAEHFDGVDAEDFQKRCDKLLISARHSASSSQANVVAATFSKKRAGSDFSKKSAPTASSAKKPSVCMFHRMYGDDAHSCTKRKCSQWREGLRFVKFVSVPENEKGTLTQE
ncbi:Hypothetical predicted protein [Paramuricea clavata]|uniref:DUF7041 domain-containing protein n=1 Tax=Paramuricea clavata TaxID=317549 RepID=A0A6S7KS13_PARCT|nr:Hypothetical predicted protein [Paramuricea clavata]